MSLLARSVATLVRVVENRQTGGFFFFGWGGVGGGGGAPRAHSISRSVERCHAGEGGCVNCQTGVCEGGGGRAVGFNCRVGLWLGSAKVGSSCGAAQLPSPLNLPGGTAFPGDPRLPRCLRFACPNPAACLPACSGWLQEGIALVGDPNYQMVSQVGPTGRQLSGQGHDIRAGRGRRRPAGLQPRRKG